MVGGTFTSTNGIMQGYPLSVILLNAYVQTWANLVRAECPGVLPKAYADDMGLTCSSLDALQHALTTTHRFAQDTGMRINADKSHVWGTTTENIRGLSHPRIGDESIPVLTGARQLGAHLSFNRRRGTTTLAAKEGEVHRICSRIQALPVVLDIRAVLVGGVVNAKALYACAATPPGKRRLRSLRAACCRAIWGQAFRTRAPEVVFTLFARGHRCDPIVACAYDTVCTARRVLRKHPDLHGMLKRVLRTRYERDDVSRIGGPGKALCEALQESGAAIGVDDLNLNFCRPGEQEGVGLSLTCPDKGGFEHLLRDSLRRQQWSRLVQRRAGFNGLEHGVDRATSLYLQPYLTGLDRYRLRCIMAGAINTQRHLYRIRAAETDLCQCCGLQPEDIRHICVDCPAHAHVRGRSGIPEAARLAAPDCLSLHGLLPEGWLQNIDQDDRRETVAKFQYMLLDILPHLGLAATGSTLAERSNGQTRGVAVRW